MDESTVKKIAGVISEVRITSRRSVWFDNGGGRHDTLTSEAGMSVQPHVGQSVDDLADQVQAWCDARVGMSLAAHMDEIAPKPHPEAFGVYARASEAAERHFAEEVAEVRKLPAVVFEAFGPPVERQASLPAPAEEEEGHTRIARFTLTHEGEDKYVLVLYPLLSPGKVGQYPELKYVANRDRMWAMLGPEWDDDWKLPLDKEVAWLADWKLGREKTGPKAKPGSRYKDLVAIHAAE